MLASWKFILQYAKIYKDVDIELIDRLKTVRPVKFCKLTRSGAWEILHNLSIDRETSLKILEATHPICKLIRLNPFSLFSQIDFYSIKYL